MPDSDLRYTHFYEVNPGLMSWVLNLNGLIGPIWTWQLLVEVNAAMDLCPPPFPSLQICVPTGVMLVEIW